MRWMTVNNNIKGITGGKLEGFVSTNPKKATESFASIFLKRLKSQNMQAKG